MNSVRAGFVDSIFRLWRSLRDREETERLLVIGSHCFSVCEAVTVTVYVAMSSYFVTMVLITFFFYTTYKYN